MAKCSVLGALLLAAGVFLVSGIQKGMAQEFDKSKYIQNNSRGVVFFFEKSKGGRTGGGTITRQDTIYQYTMPGKVLKQVKTDGSLFLDNAYVDRVGPGDTVLFYRGNLFREPFLEIRRYAPVLIPSSASPEIVFKFPPLPLSMGSSDGKSHLYTLGANYVVRETGRQIFLNDVFRGEALPGDTVELTLAGDLVFHRK